MKKRKSNMVRRGINAIDWSWKYSCFPIDDSERTSADFWSTAYWNISRRWQFQRNERCSREKIQSNNSKNKERESTQFTQFDTDTDHNDQWCVKSEWICIFISPQSENKPKYISSLNPEYSSISNSSISRSMNSSGFPEVR